MRFYGAIIYRKERYIGGVEYRHLKLLYIKIYIKIPRPKEYTIKLKVKFT